MARDSSRASLTACHWLTVTVRAVAVARVQRPLIPLAPIRRSPTAHTHAPDQRAHARAAAGHTHTHAATRSAPERQNRGRA